MSRSTSGRQTIETIEPDYAAVVDLVAPSLRRRLEEEAHAVIDSAEAAWPVGKDREENGRVRPHSRDLFVTSERVAGGRYERTVEQSARNEQGDKYGYMIKVGGRNVWKTLVTDVAKNRTIALVKDLEDDLARLAGKVK